MKKMTCKEMGGVCDAEIQGETPEEMMENGKNHVHEGTDEEHQEIVKQMEAMSEEGKAAWMEEFKGKFDAAEEV